MKKRRPENMYYSKKTFGKAFRRFLLRNEIIGLLSYCGWLDGGCRSLMKAILIWLGAENVQTYQIVKEKNQQHSDHAFIKLGDYFLDGDGVSNLNQMKKRWFFEEGLPNVYIQPFNPLTEPSFQDEEPFYIDDDSIEILVNELKETFDKYKVLFLFK